MNCEGGNQNGKESVGALVEKMRSQALRFPAMEIQAWQSCLAYKNRPSPKYQLQGDVGLDFRFFLLYRGVTAGLLCFSSFVF